MSGRDAEKSYSYVLHRNAFNAFSTTKLKPNISSAAGHNCGGLSISQTKAYAHACSVASRRGASAGEEMMPTQTGCCMAHAAEYITKEIQLLNSAIHNLMENRSPTLLFNNTRTAHTNVVNSSHRLALFWTIPQQEVRDAYALYRLTHSF